MMTRKEITIKNKTGLHARPAGELVNVVKNFECDCFIINGDNKANAKSIISLLTLGAKEGVEVSVLCEGGSDHVEACEAIIKFLEELMD